MAPGSPAGLYGDSIETLPQLSPLTRPNPRPEYPEANYFEDEQRRPSVTSVATASSQGSQSSTGRVFNRKFQGFFGEEYRGQGREASSQAQDSNVVNGRPSGSHHRNNSTATTSTGDGGTASPGSRPRSPMPSSEVAPWVYQDSEVRFENYLC